MATTNLRSVPGITRIWLVPFVVADFALFPMFHIGDIPWKPGYLALALGAFIYMRSLPRDQLRRTRTIFVLTAVLVATTLVGALIFEYQTSVGFSTTTLRAVIIYALGPLAFLVGVGDRRPRHNYLLLIISGYLVLNLVHSVFASDWDWLASFYNTDNLESGETFGRGVRVPGVMNNPNLTALTATLLLLFVGIGFRLGFVRPSRRAAVAAILLTGFVVVLMLSRNQMLAAAIASVATLLYLPRRMAGPTALTLIAIGTVGLLAVTALGNERQEQLFGIRLTQSFERRWFNTGVSTSGLAGSFLGERALARPITGVSGAIDRWETSPIFGTGFEESASVSPPRYHNDWATVLATSGLVGAAAFIFLAFFLVRLEPLLGLPLILPGLTNAFLSAPQHFVLLMLLAGLIAGRRWRQREPDGGYPSLLSPQHVSDARVVD